MSNIAAIALTPVIIHYNATPDRVEVRVRLYAGDIAVKEESFYFSEADLASSAQSAGRSVWNEADLCALVPLAGTVWRADAGEVTQDIALSPAEQVIEIKAQMATLQQRLDVLDPPAAAPALALVSE